MSGARILAVAGIISGLLSMVGLGLAAEGFTWSLAFAAWGSAVMLAGNIIAFIVERPRR